MSNHEILNFIMTILSTFVGAIMGGLVTLIVSKKFEIERIRINNINDMKNEITPALQQYMRELKALREFMFTNEFSKKISEQKKVLQELENALFVLNQKVDTYEIELSNMLDFFELLLKRSFELIEELNEQDIIEDEQQYILKFETDLDVLVDMVATFNEEVAEIKRNMLKGKIRNYWRKDIFEKEKKNRVNPRLFI